ncbi:MAG: hypothetical protein KJ714_05230 [Euryarchaeota archaeon]|nr:hypothetical protein [Euryarchaeota archaeon]
MKNYFFLIIVAFILLSSTIVLADTYVTNKFLHVKLDTYFSDIEIWEFHGTNDKDHDYACVSDYKYDSTYVCGLFITEEEAGSYDGFRVAWAKDKAVIKKSGSTLGGDLGEVKKCDEYKACPTPSNPLIVATPCSSEAAFISPSAAPINSVLGKSYSTGWVDKCDFGTCTLTKSNTEYRPKYDIFCNKESDGTGKWYRCQDYSSCLGNWACDSSAETWTDCAAQGKTCSAGGCITPTGCTPCDSGATPCGSCSAVNPEKRCVADSNNVGQLQTDSTCADCCFMVAAVPLNEGFSEPRNCHTCHKDIPAIMAKASKFTSI